MSSSNIKIYTDEDVTNSVAEALKRRGLKAWTTPEKNNRGLTDIEQIKYAASIRPVCLHTTWKIFPGFIIASGKEEILIPGLLSLNKVP